MNGQPVTGAKIGRFPERGKDGSEKQQKIIGFLLFFF
jgi:hypothetical protein